MIFDDFKVFCQDKLQVNEIKGIFSIDFDLFINESKEVRKLSTISYRLLNFIIYSCIHYSYIMGHLTEEQVQKFIPPFTTTFQIIEEDWNLLRKALFDKQIQNPQIFFNVIIPKLVELINKYDDIETIEKRNEFEEMKQFKIKKQLKNMKNIIIYF